MAIINAGFCRLSRMARLSESWLNYCQKRTYLFNAVVLYLAVKTNRYPNIILSRSLTYVLDKRFFSFFSQAEYLILVFANEVGCLRKKDRLEKTEPNGPMVLVALQITPFLGLKVRCLCIPRRGAANEVNANLPVSREDLISAKLSNGC